MIDPVTIPDGESGAWTVERFTVSEEDLAVEQIRRMINGRGVDRVGTYTRLKCQGRGVVMSDTPDERRDYYDFILNAKGHVLITGLGIGLAINPLLRSNDVKSITIIEKERDVIKLVAPHYECRKVRIIHADAFKYTPSKHYNIIWHDIWDNICIDNVEEMTKLKRKFGRFTDIQMCWCEHECRQLVKEAKKRGIL